MTRRQYYRAWRKDHQYWDKAIGRLIIFSIIMMVVLLLMSVAGLLITTLIGWCISGVINIAAPWATFKKMIINAFFAPAVIFIAVFGELELIMHQEYREWLKNHGPERTQ